MLQALSYHVRNTGILKQQSKFDVTLVMGLDVAWVADGLQRDGAHVREPVDTLLRQALTHASIPFMVVYGQGQARLNAAMMALQRICIRDDKSHAWCLSLQKLDCNRHDARDRRLMLSQRDARQFTNFCLLKSVGASDVVRSSPAEDHHPDELVIFPRAYFDR
jgi:hypothetical protein